VNHDLRLDREERGHQPHAQAAQFGYIAQCGSAHFQAFELAGELRDPPLLGALSVAMASDEVAATFASGTTPTNAGNAVSAAAGLALIDTLIDEGLVANSARMGVHFTEAVAALGDPWVGDIRFKGLLGGVELVGDRERKDILPKPLVTAIKDELEADGMLITISGPHGNVLRLQPPLSIKSEQIDTFVASLGRALGSVRDRAR